MRPGSTVTLTASVKPEWAFNDGVEWKIEQNEERTVRVDSKSEKKLVLTCLLPKKVTVVATSLDGGGVTDSKEIVISVLKGTIEINVQQDQTIKGRIQITEDENGSTLDRSKSKYLLNTSGDAILGENAYKNGYVLDSLVKEVSFSKLSGDYFLHVLIVDNFGSSQEVVSKKVHTKGTQICCDYTGNVQAVDLEPGRYKLEAWGAQGGSFNSTFYGGYGGYSTGTINLSSKTTVYVVVGKSANSTSGGFNGGGSGGFHKLSTKNIFTSFGGGGATHIGLKSGNLTNFSSDYSTNLLIAAGGGGGAIGTIEQDRYASHNTHGGCGGGYIGADGNSDQGSQYAGTGATQSQGGKSNRTERGIFGQGSNCGNYTDILGGGGGGGFYGGGSGGNCGSGGGGSGYINTTKLTDASMYGYNVPTSSSTESKTFTTTDVSTDAVSNCAKKNDGYVKITLI